MYFAFCVHWLLVNALASILLNILGMIFHVEFDVVFPSRAPNMMFAIASCSKGCVEYINLNFINHSHFVANVTQWLDDVHPFVLGFTEVETQRNMVSSLLFPKPIYANINLTFHKLYPCNLKFCNLREKTQQFQKLKHFLKEEKSCNSLFYNYHKKALIPCL